MLNFVSENGKIVVLTNSCIVVRPTTNHTLRPSKAERPQTVQLFVSANASLGGVFLCPNAYALAVGRGKTSLPGKIATSTKKLPEPTFDRDKQAITHIEQGFLPIPERKSGAFGPRYRPPDTADGSSRQDIANKTQSGLFKPNSSRRNA
jgi:hypothetical protein